VYVLAVVILIYCCLRLGFVYSTVLFKFRRLRVSYGGEIIFWHEPGNPVMVRESWRFDPGESAGKSDSSEESPDRSLMSRLTLLSMAVINKVESLRFYAFSACSSKVTVRLVPGNESCKPPEIFAVALRITLLSGHCSWLQSQSAYDFHHIDHNSYASGPYGLSRHDSGDVDIYNDDDFRPFSWTIPRSRTESAASDNKYSVE
jgi:hypothetical protein